MSSRSTYGASSSYGKAGGAASRSPSTSSYASSSSPRSSPSQSLYTNASSRRYGSKPGGVVIHNGGGTSNDPNTSSSAPNSGITSKWVYGCLPTWGVCVRMAFLWRWTGHGMELTGLVWYWVICFILMA
ncbi:hypothetical protein BCR34DRAFT_606932 [Clohesyomyces aquaticus]|uniref:Uncharacterized protein n=1 Tax=Clohesyomyces aquaticus TaxID=1231657 RepID=A0A1Y1YKA0_9PLEO|nr:hypothetical protein BCR34DRAFT_606932 [Clohesyomyces aquaticus]